MKSMTMDKLCFNLLLMVVPVNFIFDFVYYLGGSLFSILRILFNLGVLTLVYFTQRKMISKKFSLLLFLAIYWFVLMLYSSNLASSAMEYMKVIVPLLFFPVSYYLVNTQERFNQFQRTNLYCLAFYLVFVLISNKFEVGDTSYIADDEEAYKTGLGHSKLYPIAIFVGLLPFIIGQSVVKSKKIWMLIGFINTLLLVLSLRRTTIVIIVFLVFLYLVLSRKFGTLTKIIVGSAVLFMLAFPIIQDDLYKRLEHREYLTSDEYSVEDEGRYLEFFQVIENFNDQDRPGITYLFGKEAFNTIGNFGFYKARPIHVDYTYVFFSSGLIGICLYLLFLFRVYRWGVLYKKQLKNYVSLDYFAAFQAVFVLIFIVGFSGTMWAITYKTVVFTLLGSFLGMFRGKLIEMNLYKENDPLHSVKTVPPVQPQLALS
jgi:hypothetical protein